MRQEHAAHHVGHVTPGCRWTLGWLRRCQSRRAGTDRLGVDPAKRRVVDGRAKEKEAASTSEMSRFETEILSSRRNLTALMNLSGMWIDSIQECVPLDKLILERIKWFRMPPPFVRCG